MNNNFNDSATDEFSHNDSCDTDLDKIDSSVRAVLIRIRPTLYNDLIRENERSEHINNEGETLCSSPDVRSEVPVRLGASQRGRTQGGGAYVRKQPDNDLRLSQKSTRTENCSPITRKWQKK